MKSNNGMEKKIKVGRDGKENKGGKRE